MSDAGQERRRVYDPALRFLHWWNAAAIVALLATGWGVELFEHGALERAVWTVHVYAGHGLVLGLATRLAWAFVGLRHARLADMWHPQAWRRVLTDFRLPDRHRWGHDPLASAAFLALYGMLAVMAVTGLALAASELGMGPLAGGLLDGVARRARGGAARVSRELRRGVHRRARGRAVAAPASRWRAGRE